MKAALLTRPGFIEIKYIHDPVIGPEDLLIKIKRVCICGSDNHIYNEGIIAKSDVVLPFILGHECSGEVIEIGKNVTGFKKGDRVTVEPSSFCGKCEFCRSGRYNMCDSYRFLAAPPDNQGAFCEMISHDYHNCFLLPDNMTYEEGAIVEPLAIIVQAFEISNFKVNDDVLIHGAGPIGLLALMLLRAMGAGKCIITDLNDYKLNIAKRLGADFTINVLKNNVVSITDSLTNSSGIPVIFDTVGMSKTLSDSISTSGKNATIVVIGISDDKASFDIVDLICKMLVLKGTTDFVNCFPKAIRLIENKKVEVMSVISHYYDFNDLNIAFKNMNTNPQTIKTMIRFD